ncbi:unnamed protein product [Linum trigynum]|uniref:Uncharacterized protein n=1 Tax=Linum trigynum TaxID=586398 RepID=A0AAV2FAP3_9ROSI
MVADVTVEDDNPEEEGDNPVPDAAEAKLEDMADNDENDSDAAEAILEDLADNDDNDLDRFAAALAYAEEGFHIAASVVMPGGLVDYS